VRNTTFLLLFVTIIGTVSSTFAQTTQGNRSQNSRLQGKNVTVYLEDAEFGILAEKFVYDPNARLVDIQDENPKTPAKSSPAKNSGVMSVHFVEKNIAPAQSPQPKKMTPRPLGTNLSAKPLLGKPQKPAAAPEELSFDSLPRISLVTK